MRLSRFIVIATFGTTLTFGAHAQSCHESFITTPSPFLGNNDEVFKLGDGSIWQVKYEYQYLYAYHPQVVICPGKNKLIINGKQLHVELLSQESPGSSAGARTSQRVKSAQTVRTTQRITTENAEVADDRGREADSAALIETQIAGDFSGWEGETIFKLANGQIWQQTQYAYTYHYAFMPKVIIFKSDGAYQMQVEGVGQRIGVRRLK
jgi:hypothetical protein